MNTIKKKVDEPTRLAQAKRLVTAFNYLKSKGAIHTQAEAAKKVGASPSNFSAALKGKVNVLTISFLLRFNEAFGFQFNEKWLLEGDGDMLNSEGKEITQTATGDGNTQVAGNGNHVTPSGPFPAEKIIAEMSAQREAYITLLTEKDAQIRRLLTLLETSTCK